MYSVLNIELGSDFELASKSRQDKGWKIDSDIKNKIFYHGVRFEKEGDQLLLACDRKMRVSLISLSRTCQDEADFNQRYIEHLEVALRNGVSAMPKYAIDEINQDNPKAELVNLFYNRKQELAFLMRDTSQGKPVLLATFLSMTLVGLASERRVSGSYDSSDLSIADIIGVAGGIAGIASLF